MIVFFVKCYLINYFELELIVYLIKKCFVIVERFVNMMEWFGGVFLICVLVFVKYMLEVGLVILIVVFMKEGD